MKKNRSKAEQESANEAFVAEMRQTRYRNNGVKPRDFVSRFPTQQQLAMLAATLARDSATPPAKLCSQAMELWAAADEYIELQKKCNEDWKVQKVKIEAERIKIPEPKKFPMSWEEFIRLMLPETKGRTDRQASIYKAWLRHSIMMSRYLNDHGPIQSQGPGWVEYIQTEKTPSDFVPTQDEVDKEFAKDRQTPMDSLTYRRRAFAFVKWYRGWKENETSRKRAEAAKLRFKKTKSSS